MLSRLLLKQLPNCLAGSELGGTGWLRGRGMESIAEVSLSLCGVKRDVSSGRDRCRNGARENENGGGYLSSYLPCWRGGGGEREAPRKRSERLPVKPATFLHCEFLKRKCIIELILLCKVSSAEACMNTK